MTTRNPLSSEKQKTWQKSLWRLICRLMVEETGFIANKLNKFNLLILPGREHMELEEVAEILKFPKQNIYGVEDNEKEYTELDNKELGINMYHMSIENFVKNPKKYVKNNKNFSLIIADFQGMSLESSNFEFIKDIATKRLIVENGIIVINRLNARDKQFKDEYLKIHEDVFGGNEDYSERQKIENVLVYKTCNNFKKYGVEKLRYLHAVKYNSGYSPMFSYLIQINKYKRNN